MKNGIKHVKRQVQTGMTLVELVVVVAVIGILAVMLAPSMIGSKDGAKSQLLLKASRDMAMNWLMISQKCNTSTDVSSTPIPASGKTVEDVLFGGISNVAAGYQTCYAQAKVMAMSEVAQLSGSTWKVQGFNATVSGGGSNPLQIAYAGIPEELALLMAQEYSPSLSALATSDSTSNVVRYSALSSGARTVTVVRQVG